MNKKSDSNEIFEMFLFHQYLSPLSIQTFNQCFKEAHEWAFSGKIEVFDEDDQVEEMSCRLEELVGNAIKELNDKWLQHQNADESLVLWDSIHELYELINIVVRMCEPAQEEFFGNHNPHSNEDIYLGIQNALNSNLEWQFMSWN